MIFSEIALVLHQIENTTIYTADNVIVTLQVLDPKTQTWLSRFLQAPKGARSSSGTLLTVEVEMSSSEFLYMSKLDISYIFGEYFRQWTYKPARCKIWFGILRWVCVGLRADM